MALDPRQTQLVALVQQFRTNAAQQQAGGSLQLKPDRRLIRSMLAYDRAIVALLKVAKELKRYDRKTFQRVMDSIAAIAGDPKLAKR